MLKHLLQHLNAPRNEGMQQVRMALEQFQVRLLIVDDAEFLNREQLETLQKLTEKTGCNIQLLGPPDLLASIKARFQGTARIEYSADIQSSQEDV